MTFVSLFAGIGGFDLGLERAGHQCVGQVEIDPHARGVLTRHWPNVPKHDDVTTLKHDTFPHPELVTFGSPCQDLSVAGKRAGLDGERSGLFLEAVRYIRDIQEATDGLLPRFALWENVPGAYSSNNGRDFAAVLASLVGGQVRTPTLGWPNAGVAFGPLGSAEWRTLDSQHFGVAQRRRRVFLVYRPGGERAGEVLLEPEGVRGHPAPGRKERQELAPSLSARASYDRGDGSEPIVPVTQCLTSGTGRRYDPETETLVPVAFKVRGGKEGGGKGYLGSHDQALTISTVQEQFLAAPIAFDRTQITSAANRTRAEPGLPTGTLAANSDMHVAVSHGWGEGNTSEISGNITNTIWPSLSGGHGGGAGHQYRQKGNEDALVPEGYAVRRLTPRECERLQAFPDDHTEGHADTHRYRMLGNAVTVTVIEWIGRRLPA